MDVKTITEVRSEMNQLQIALNKMQATFNQSNVVLAQRIVELDRELSTVKSQKAKLFNALDHLLDLACAAGIEGDVYERAYAIYEECLKELPNETK